MTLEQAAIAVIGILGGVVSFLYLRNESARTAEIDLIKKSSDECQKWRAEKEPIITEMANRLGVAEGVATFVNACSVSGCPFKGKLDTSYSLAPKEEKRP
jgi:hypothetical protein